MSDATNPPRTLRLHVLRHNPQDPESRPRMETFEVTEAPGMTLFIALTEIRERQDASLNFDFVCRAGICGSCGMLIDGKPGLACRTLTQDHGEDITLAPLPVFELISDLSVNTGRWMRDMSERLETWVHEEGEEADVAALEAPMDPDLAEEIYELERCIECGCCIAACGTAHMRPDFVGAVGLNKLARFRLDPRDTRDDAQFYELVGDESGVFGCLTLAGCEDLCPKDLPLVGQFAFLRRRLAGAATRRRRD
ncbi:MAG: fumarate reductase iron-sulfur subunit [Gammaproteobacteria bacterium]